MNRDQAESLLGFPLDDGWTLHEVRRGKLAGFVLQKGSEVHAWRMPQFTGRWFTRGDVRRILLPILAEFGVLTTKVRQGNETGYRFVTRLGFVPVGSEGGNVLYEARSLNHA